MQRKATTILHLLLALTLLAACDSAARQIPAASSAPAAPGKPNIVFILTDDLDAESFKLFPRLKSLLGDQGVTFNDMFVTDSLCCPSRSSILRSEFVHNHQVYSNGGPQGGFEQFHALGNENSTIATWMQAAGYRTALMGKYLNGYPNTVAPTYVPPGWSEWDSPAAGNPYSEYNYSLNENGKLVQYGSTPNDYLVDVLSHKGADFIGADPSKPFFLYLATYVPHQPATPAPRYADAFPDAKAPRTPSFNEADVSDKPAWLRDQPLLTAAGIAEIDALYRKRLQTMLGMEDLVANLIAKLQATGQLDNTYLFFGSDNGFHLGQHRQHPGKQTAFEEDIKVPLVVRGPGIPAGQSRDQAVLNIDLAPTWAALGGATVPDFANGRSLLPLLRADQPTPSIWRQNVLVEHYGTAGPVAGQPTPAVSGTPDPDDESQFAPTPAPGPGGNGGKKANKTGGPPQYSAIRTAQYTYVEYVTGEKELYDRRSDPYELTNIAANPGPAPVAQLAARLAALRTCSGAACQAVENNPVGGAAPAPVGGGSVFSETGQTVRDPFLAYWTGHGGVAQQGLPLSGELLEQSPTDGKTYPVQYFERAVFEQHPENAAPFNVLLSLLGSFRYKEKYPNGAPGQTANSSPDSQLFAQTGRRVGGSFLAYWQGHGGLAQQGYPISDEFQEKSDLNGQTYTVQYFERAVFELHPENAGTPYTVLLSQLGLFRYRAQHGTGQAIPLPTLPATRPVGAITAPVGTTLSNVPYCRPDGVVLTMDLSFPAGGAARPAVLFVHGGGWTQGSKENVPFAKPQLLAAGYVVASINYRLAPQYKWPAQIEDSKCAVRFLRANAAQYGIAADRIGAWGGSAGGHLVSLLGLTGPDAGFEGTGDWADQSSAVRAVVDMFGPTDLTNYPAVPQGQAVARNVFGVEPGSDSDVLRRASPVTYVRADAPPFLILQGTEDKTVAPSQSQLLYDRLHAVGAPVTLVLVQHAGHGFAPVGGPIQPSLSEIADQIVAFFNTNLR